MPFAPKQCATTRKRLRVMGVQLQIFDASSSRDIDAAFAALARERASPRPHRCSALLTSRSKSLLFTEVSRIRRSCEVVAARDL
jgi:hypothetical protein